MRIVLRNTLPHSQNNRPNLRETLLAANHTAVVSIAGSTPISTSVYSQLIASTPFASCTLVLANSTDQNVSIAIGASGNEVDLACVASGTSVVLNLSNNQFKAGVRVSVISQIAATTSGTFTLSMIP